MYAFPPEIPLPVSLCLFLTRTIGCYHTFPTELVEFVPITSTTGSAFNKGVSQRLQSFHFLFSRIRNEYCYISEALIRSSSSLRTMLSQYSGVNRLLSLCSEDCCWSHQHRQPPASCLCPHGFFPDMPAAGPHSSPFPWQPSFGLCERAAKLI